MADVLRQIIGINPAEPVTGRLWNTVSRYVRPIFTAINPDLELYFNRLAYVGRLLQLDFSTQADLAARLEPLDAESLQLQMWLAAAELVEAAASTTPLCLILEDLHWADFASIEALQYILNQTNDHLPLLFCLTFRSQRSAEIWRMWHRIERDLPRDIIVSLELQELTREVGRELVSQLLETTVDLPDELIDEIHTQTDGNPLYIEESIQTLVNEGALIQRSDRWTLSDLKDVLTMPSTLYQIIQSRIDALDFESPGARWLLWLASVIGQAISISHSASDLSRIRLEPTGISNSLSHLTQRANAGSQSAITVAIRSASWFHLSSRPLSVPAWSGVTGCLQQYGHPHTPPLSWKGRSMVGNKPAAVGINCRPVGTPFYARGAVGEGLSLSCPSSRARFWRSLPIAMRLNTLLELLDIIPKIDADVLKRYSRPSSIRLMPYPIRGSYWGSYIRIGRYDDAMGILRTAAKEARDRSQSLTMADRLVYTRTVMKSAESMSFKERISTKLLTGGRRD